MTPAARLYKYRRGDHPANHHRCCGGDLNKVPPILFVQLDNTSSTNKNNMQVAAMAALVELGIVREVWVNFLPKGHTHEDIDQMFSVISHAFDYNPPRSLPEMMEIIRNIGKDARADSGELRTLKSLRGVRIMTRWLMRIFMFSKCISETLDIKKLSQLTFKKQ